MIVNVIASRNRVDCAVLLASSALLAASPVQAQQEEPDVRDVAETPLEDIGAKTDEIPVVLNNAVSDPYASEGLATCNDIVAEIARLDTVLGEDYDIAGKQDTGLSVGKAAKGVVGSIIPFRGIVREVSGAAGDERKARAAWTAGMVRRGYLKGLGQSRGCDYPARPKPEGSK